MKAKISIIIPVYNVEPYIRKCLDSVVGQTYENLEILVINDGSTDGSEKICDAYARKDARIQVFHKENGGLSSALNVGLNNFTGDFLGFVDSDDWIEPDMYQALYNALNGADIAVCSYYKDTFSSSEIMKNAKIISEPVISTENMLLYPLMRDDYMGFCGYVWNKLYAGGVVRESGIFFDEEIKYAMDVLFYKSLVSKMNCTGVFVEKPLIHYVQRDGAITKSESFAVKADILKVYKRVEEMLPPKDRYWARGFYCYHASVICELARKKRDQEMLEKMQQEIKAHYDDYKRTNERFPGKCEQMKGLMAIRLVNRQKYDINRFNEQVAERSIVCFGLYIQFSDWIMQNPKTAGKITDVIDNNVSVQGGALKIEERRIKVSSLAVFIKKRKTDFVFLINTNRHVDDIVKQLDFSGEFNGVDVYVAELKKYKDNETVKKVQAVQLEVLDEFVRICEKHNLKYYLTGGTLLGAVRHKGFIPWDDDIDVDMPKRDFNKLIRLSHEFNHEYYLHWVTTDSRCVHIPARLKKRNTYRLEWAKGYERANEKNNAVGICIFRIVLTKRKTVGSVSRYEASAYDRFWLNTLEKIHRVAYKKSGFSMTSPKTFFSLFPIPVLLKLREVISNLYNSETGYFCEKPGKEVFGEGISLAFEGKHYNVASDWHYWLTKKYGAGYMQLPPSEKRLSHCPRKLSLDVKNDIWEDL